MQNMFWTKLASCPLAPKKVSHKPRRTTCISLNGHSLKSRLKHKTSPYLWHIRSFCVPKKTEKCSKLELKFIWSNITSNKQQHEHKMFRKIAAGKTEKFYVLRPHISTEQSLRIILRTAMACLIWCLGISSRKMDDEAARHNKQGKECFK